VEKTKRRIASSVILLNPLTLRGGAPPAKHRGPGCTATITIRPEQTKKSTHGGGGRGGKLHKAFFPKKNL